MSKKMSKMIELKAENERLREQLKLKGMVYSGGGVRRKATGPYPKDKEPDYARCLPLMPSRPKEPKELPDWAERLPKLITAVQNIITEVEAVKEATRGTRYDRYGLELATRIQYLVEEGHDGDSLGDLVEDIRVIEEVTDSHEALSPPIGAAAEMFFEAELKGGKTAELRIHMEGSRFIGMLCPGGRCGIVMYSESQLDEKVVAEIAITVFEETYGNKLKRIVLVENDQDDGQDLESDTDTTVAGDMTNRVRKILNA